jgi:hypothetical protein
LRRKPKELKSAIRRFEESTNRSEKLTKHRDEENGFAPLSISRQLGCRILAEILLLAWEVAIKIPIWLEGEFERFIKRRS